MINPTVFPNMSQNKKIDAFRMITRLCGTSELRRLGSQLEKAIHLHEKHAIPLHFLEKASLGSRFAIMRARTATREGREIGKEGRPTALSKQSQELLHSFIQQQKARRPIRVTELQAKV